MLWDRDKAVGHLRKHGLTHSTGRCAQFTREAVEAGGVQLIRHGSAKDYGDSLTRVGFQALEQLEVRAFQPATWW
jgi:hypothetical protein